MSETQNAAGQVLAAATTAGGGIAVLPLTGSSWLLMLLPLTAIACGSIILLTLSLTHLLEQKNKKLLKRG